MLSLLAFLIFFPFKVGRSQNKEEETGKRNKDAQMQKWRNWFDTDSNAGARDNKMENSYQDRCQCLIKKEVQSFISYQVINI